MSPRALIGNLLLGSICLGCTADESVFNAPADIRMAPFEGEWQYDKKATYAEMKKRGVDPRAIAMQRRLQKVSKPGCACSIP